MKRVLQALWFLFVLVAIASVWAPARAATEYPLDKKAGTVMPSQTGGIQQDSTTEVLRFDDDGNLLTASGAVSWKIIRGSALSNRFVYGADGLSAGWASSGNQPKVVTVDSVGTFDVRGFKNLAALFTIVAEDSVYASLWGFQVRFHENAGMDSSSQYPVLGRYGASSDAITDTLGSFKLYGAYEMGGPTGSLIAFGNASLDTSMFTAGEQPLVVKMTRGTTQNFAVLLSNDRTESLGAGFLSMRLRLMGTYDATMAPFNSSDGTATGTSIYGSAPRGANTNCEKCGGTPTTNPVAWGRWVTVRIDLVGWN